MLKIETTEDAKEHKTFGSISLWKFVFSVVKNKKSTDYTNYTEN